MVKTPRRKKTVEESEEATENGDRSSATPQRPIVASPPASRTRRRQKRRRGESDDDEDSMVTTDDDDETHKPPPAKRRSTRRERRKKANDSDDASSVMSTTDDEGEKKRPAKRRSTRGRKKKTTTSSDDDESMAEESKSEQKDEYMYDEDSKPRAKQNGYKRKASAATASLPTVQEEEPPTNGMSASVARLEPISKLRMPSKHTPGKLEARTTALAPTRRQARQEDDSRRLQFGVPTNNVLNQVPPIVAAGSSGSGTATTQQQQVVAIDTRTASSPPGVDNAELNAILVEGTEQQQQQPPQQQVQVSWIQLASTSLGTMVYSFGDFVTSLVVPQAEQLAEEEEDVQVHVTTPILTRPIVWFLLLLLLQVACWNPVVQTVQETSDRSLNFYKSLLGAEENGSDVAPVNVSAPEEPQTDVPKDVVDADRIKELERLAQLLESVDTTSSIDSDMAFIEQQLLEIRGRTRERTQALQDWKDGLKDVEKALYAFITTESMDDVPRLFFNANEILGFFKDMVPPTLATDILDTTYVFLWQTESTTECSNTQPSDSDDSNDKLLTREMLQMGKDELREMSSAASSEIMSNDELLRAIRVWIRESLPQNTTIESNKEEEDSKPMKGLTQDMAHEVIAGCLERQEADQLGRVDYASILAGATVVEHATSPSLVDSLPLVNRLLEQAGLRFYGYGPQAALTPTFPVNALGQCWAFEKDTKRVANGGRYATLTVQLNKPVYVTSVVVEHAAKEITNQLESAIRNFRVLGYEDADAFDGDDSWPLGSFEYDIDAPRILQEFEVANHANGEHLPKLNMITLAIDSNWGFPYSCLYRFRVLGSDEPSTNAIEVSYNDDFTDETDDDEEEYYGDTESEVSGSEAEYDRYAVPEELEDEIDGMTSEGAYEDGNDLDESVGSQHKVADYSESNPEHNSTHEQASEDRFDGTVADDDQGETSSQQQDQPDVRTGNDVAADEAKQEDERGAEEARHEDPPGKTKDSAIQDEVGEARAAATADSRITPEEDDASDVDAESKSEQAASDSSSHSDNDYPSDETAGTDGAESRHSDNVRENEAAHRWDSNDHDYHEEDSSDDEDSGSEDEDSGDPNIRVEYHDGIRYEYHIKEEASGDDGGDSRDD